MLQDIVDQRCKDGGGELIEFNGEVDHVHALISLPPNLDLSRFVNNLKTTPSRLIRREFARHLRDVYRKPVFWSRSYSHLLWWWRTFVRDQAIRRAAEHAGVIFGLRPKPPSPPPWLRRGWSTGGDLVEYPQP